MHMQKALAAMLLCGSLACGAATAAPVPLLIDGHNDLLVHYMDCKTCPRGLADYDIRFQTSGDTDIPRLRSGGVGGILLNVFSSEKSTIQTLVAFDFLRKMERKYAADFEVAATANDVRRIHRQGRIALIPVIEGATRLENLPMMVRTLHRLGLRAVTLAYKTNDLADGSNDTARHNGLSALGRTMVLEMNKTGVLVDISHVSTKTMHDVLDISIAPVIFSHSSARALVDVPRNVPDDVLIRMPKNGGLVMVSFVPYFTTKAHAAWADSQDKLDEDLNRRFEAGKITESQGDSLVATWKVDHPEPVVTIAQVADHIEHVRKVAGIDHVGIGSDFDGMPQKVRGLEDISKFPNLLAELRRRGWKEAEIAKLAGGNFLRAMERAEQVAAAE